MELVNRESASDEDCAKDRHVHENELPVCRTIVREDLELGIEVEVEKDCLC